MEAAEHTPRVEQYGDDISVSWLNLCTCFFTHFIDSRFGTMAELSVMGADLSEVAWGQILLVSTDSRGKFAKRVPPPYAQLIDLACRLALGHYRKPPPVLELHPQRRVEGAEAWIWQPWLPAGQTAVLYGDGDSGKSLLALTIAVCALNGLPLAGTYPLARLDSVLFVDYESTYEDHAHRLALLAQALDLPSVRGLHYWRPMRPLPELRPVLVGLQQRLKAQMVVLDSVGAAAGGEPESAQAAVAVHNTLFSLGPACARLVIGHVTKLEGGTPTGPRRLYGSVYGRNLPRVLVEMRRAEEDTSLRVTLRQEKNNLVLRRPPPIGLEVQGGDDHLVWVPTDPETAMLGLKARVLDAVDSVERTVRNIAERSEGLVSRLVLQAVRVVLNRLVDAKQIAKRERPRGAKSSEIVYWREDSDAKQDAKQMRNSREIDPHEEGGLSFP